MMETDFLVPLTGLICLHEKTEGEEEEVARGMLGNQLRCAGSR